MASAITYFTSYSPFQVIATETANSSHVATATVILNLIDMNDNNPLFDQASYTFYIDENSPNRTTVGTIAVYIIT